MGFEDIVGHDKPKILLRTFVGNNNIPHAFLFYGQEGIGKKLVAREFAKHLFCESKKGCGICRPCLKVDHGNHPDLIIIENENSITIDQSRMLSKEVYEYPHESDRRVIIIDNAESFTREAANALLKTLEEPPPFNLFVLISSSEQEIPITIRSRCTRIFFTALAVDQARDFFSRSLPGDAFQAELLARISYGSIGYGLFWAEEENFQLRRIIAELITGKKKGFVHASLITEKVSKIANGFDIYLAFLSSFFRDMLILKQLQDGEKIINIDVEEYINGGQNNTEWIQASLKRIQETAAIMRYNVNKSLVFENMLFHVMR